MLSKVLDCADGAPPKVAKRYRGEMILASALYVIAVAVSAFVLRWFDPPLWVAVAMAAAALAPVGLMLRAYLRYLAGLDEFQRRVQMESLLIAAAVVAFGSLTYGFLQAFAGFPVIEDALIWVFPAMCVVWGFAQVFVRRRYR
ncbi:MAG: hypothetical protein K2P58_01050 [Hyphomonadaceae bacterium]|nr:hypothetical protein [Hyphomonadaceae bacterium]